MSHLLILCSVKASFDLVALIVESVVFVTCVSVTTYSIIRSYLDRRADSKYMKRLVDERQKRIDDQPKLLRAVELAISVLESNGIKPVVKRHFKEHWDLICGPVYDYCQSVHLDFNEFVDLIYPD